MSDSVRPHRQQPTRLPCPWDSPGKNTGVGCHFRLQCMKGKSESEVAQSCLTLHDPMDCSLPGSSIHGIFQARVLEWGAIAFSRHGHRRQYFTPRTDLRKVFLNEYFLGSHASQASGEGKRKCHESSLNVSKQLCLFSLFSRRDYWKLSHNSLSSNLYSCPINKALCKGIIGHSYL